MFKHSNRGISPLLAIGIIAVLAVVASKGILVYQHHYIAKKVQPGVQTSTTESSKISSKGKLSPKELSQRLLECENIQDDFDRDDCYANLAIDANDPSLCPKFGSSICKYFVFMWHTNLCRDIPIKKPVFEPGEDQATLRGLEKKQECIKKIAIETKNVELCKNLFDQAADCQDTIALELNDPSKCYSEDCVMKIAINKKDISICESKFDKAWCMVIFPKLLKEPSYRQNHKCYMQPIGIDYGESARPEYEHIKPNYTYPNTYDSGMNDYPKDIAPESTFSHILSIPFNNSNAILRVYKSSSDVNSIRFIRLIKYSPSNNSSELVGDIISRHGASWGGIYIPMAISKDDNYIIFKAQMGSPGAGGGSITMGYAYLPLKSLQYDECGYLSLVTITDVYQMYFYDGFRKALFCSEGKNVPPSERPGPYYDSAIKFMNITTGETKPLLEEQNTLYKIVSIDEKSGILNFKSCPWSEYRFGCSTSDSSTKSRSISLP